MSRDSTRETTFGGTRRERLAYCGLPAAMRAVSRAGSNSNAAPRRRRSPSVSVVCDGSTQIFAMGALTANGSPLRSENHAAVDGDRNLAHRSCIALKLEEVALGDHEVAGAARQAKQRDQETRHHRAVPHDCRHRLPRVLAPCQLPLARLCGPRASRRPPRHRRTLTTSCGKPMPSSSRATRSTLR